MSDILSPLTQKRILGDIKFLNKHQSEFVDAYPDEQNMLIWYFLIRGIDEYAGGWYIGKIIHDREYPLKAPDVQMLTPSGRYTININLCLSFTKFHPEQWSSLWNVRHLLDGLHSNMNDDKTSEQGIGYIKCSPEERAIYAKESIDYNLAHYQTIYKNFSRFVNIDGTPKTDEEIKSTLKTDKKKEKTDA